MNGPSETIAAPPTSIPSLTHPGLGEVPPFVGEVLRGVFGGGLGKEVAVWMYLAGYPGEVGSGGLPQCMLTGPRSGGDSEIRKDCTNPVISCSFFIQLFYDHAIKCLL